MEVRESKLLIIAVMMGVLVAIPLACGGGDDGGNTTTNTNGDAGNAGGDNTTGGDAGHISLGDSGAGGDSTGDSDNQQQICQDIDDRLTTCKSSIVCALDLSTFVSDCVQAAEFTATDRDEFASVPCDVLNALCTFTTGTCSGDNVCIAIDSTDGICATNTGGAPAGAQDCTTTACTDQTQICAGSAGADNCFDQCAPPVCSGGLTCQIVASEDDGTLDTACMQTTGDFPGDAASCTTGADCPANSGCLDLNNAGINKCVQFCFINDGTGITESTSVNKTKLLMKN